MNDRYPKPPKPIKQSSTFHDKDNLMGLVRAIVGPDDWAEMYIPDSDIPIIINTENYLKEIREDKHGKKARKD